MSDSEKNHIVMVRQLEPNISRNISGHGEVSIHQKCSKEAQPVKRRQGYVHTRLLNQHDVCVRHLPGEEMAPGCTMGKV